MPNDEAAWRATWHDRTRMNAPQLLQLQGAQQEARHNYVVACGTCIRRVTPGIAPNARCQPCGIHGQVVVPEWFTAVATRIF